MLRIIYAISVTSGLDWMPAPKLPPIPHSLLIAGFLSPDLCKCYNKPWGQGHHRQCLQNISLKRAGLAHCLAQCGRPPCCCCCHTGSIRDPAGSAGSPADPDLSWGTTCSAEVNQLQRSFPPTSPHMAAHRLPPLTLRPLLSASEPGSTPVM